MKLQMHIERVIEIVLFTLKVSLWLCHDVNVRSINKQRNYKFTFKVSLQLFFDSLWLCHDVNMRVIIK